MATCDECKALVEKTLYALFAIDAITDCAEIAAAFDAECIIAAGGPEDPVGDVVCTVAAAAILVICLEIGFVEMKNNVPAAAERICKAIGIC